MRQSHARLREPRAPRKAVLVWRLLLRELRHSRLPVRRRMRMLLRPAPPRSALPVLPRRIRAGPHKGQVVSRRPGQSLRRDIRLPCLYQGRPCSRASPASVWLRSTRPQAPVPTGLRETTRLRLTPRVTPQRLLSVQPQCLPSKFRPSPPRSKPPRQAIKTAMTNKVKTPKLPSRAKRRTKKRNCPSRGRKSSSKSSRCGPRSPARSSTSRQISILLCRRV